MAQGHPAPSARAVSFRGPLASKCQLLAIVHQEAAEETGLSGLRSADSHSDIQERARKLLKMEAIIIRVKIPEGQDLWGRGVSATSFQGL